MPKHSVQLISSHIDTPAESMIDMAIGPLAVRSRRLAGGRREGVLLVELVAGNTRVLVLPDRGLGIWRMMAGDVELG